MKRKLLAFCTTLVLAFSAVAAVPVLPVAQAPVAQAAQGADPCPHLESPEKTIAYSIIDRPTSGTLTGRYTAIYTDFLYGNLTFCDPLGSVGGQVLDYWGYSQMWLSGQSGSGGSSTIVQVGYQMCGNLNGCAFPNGTIAFGSSAFVYSTRDDTSHGHLRYWTGGPDEVFGHEYRLSIAEGSSNNWNICIDDLDTAGGVYCKSITRTIAIKYMWIGCEAHNDNTYCGTDDDFTTQSKANQMRYTRSTDGVTYSINNQNGGVANCEYPTLGSQPVYSPDRDCDYNSDHSIVTFQTQDAP